MPGKLIKWHTVVRARAGPGRILEGYGGSRHKERALGGGVRSVPLSKLIQQSLRSRE